MNQLRDYLANRLATELKGRRIVVWYDPRSEFADFISELNDDSLPSDNFSTQLSGIKARIVVAPASLFELRSIVEPLVCADEPDPLLIYLQQRERDPNGSILMELELAGTLYDPKLKQIARNLLRNRYTDGVIDEVLATEKLTYSDIARVLSDTDSTESPSMLKGIFQGARGNDGIVVSWLADDARDGEIEMKQAKGELVKLVKSRLGFELPSEASLAKLRAITLRYVLAGEFRSDLNCEAPSCLEGVPFPATNKNESQVRTIASDLRAQFPQAYAEIADRVEQELGLRGVTVDAQHLGAIDTFRFEERSLLSYCADLIIAGNFAEALKVTQERENSFWLDRDVERKAQWEASRLMAEMGQIAVAISSEMKRAIGDASTWVKLYTEDDGWFRLDQAQRRLEAWIARLFEEPDERPLGVVRRVYDDACHAMAVGFTKALKEAGWSVSGSLHQTQIFGDIVSSQPKPVAYFLVDAMRFEMGVELSERLPKAAECAVRYAIGMLPSITPIGMAALQPGASASFTVVEKAGKLGAQIEDTFLPDLTARKKFTSARIPTLADMTLDELLGLPPTKLRKKIHEAQVIIVRSQEIDHAGETGFTFQARQVMDTVIDNLARAIRKLSSVGVEYAVVSADHGHLFFASDRDESMRTDAPGGQTIELHRRCWIGRGGSTPTGCTRVTASSLGYDSDLDFVFPVGSGVFRAGGDLAFHHGGPSLQELIIPVVTVRTHIEESAPKVGPPIDVAGLPEAVTNRIFSLTLTFGGKQMLLGESEMLVRPMLMFAGKQVGSVKMVVDAELDRDTGCVMLAPNTPTTIAFLLSDDSVDSVRVIVQDPTNDAELYRSPTDIPVRLGV